MAKSSVKEFLKRKNVNITVQTYLIDALGAMAFGLFASLLIGTIFGTLGRQLQIEIFNVIADYAKSATGAALGIAIAHALKAPQLVLFSAATVGIAGNALGGPVGALVATIVAAELGKIVSRETRLDIIVTPGITIISGVLVAQFVGPGVAQFMNWFGNLVKTATEMQPFIMGILVSVLIGIALTLPISKMCIRDRSISVAAGCGICTADRFPLGILFRPADNSLSSRHLTHIYLLCFCFYCTFYYTLYLKICKHFFIFLTALFLTAVSYTHLDVYKRQGHDHHGKRDAVLPPAPSGTDPRRTTYYQL